MRGLTLLLLACGPGPELPDSRSDDGLEPLLDDTDGGPRDGDRRDCLALPVGPLAFPQVRLRGLDDQSELGVLIDNLCDVPVEGLTLALDGDDTILAPVEGLEPRIPAFRRASASLRFRPDEPSGARATLTASGDGQDPVQVELTAEAVMPFLGLDPPLATITAGAGCTRTAVVTLANQGDAPLSITALSFEAEVPSLVLDPATFDDGALPWTLAAARTRDVRIAFTPETDDELVDGDLVVDGSASGETDRARALIRARASPQGCE